MADPYARTKLALSLDQDKKRDFAMRFTIAICPTVTEFAYNNAVQIMSKYVRGPGITGEDVMRYQSQIAEQTRNQILNDCKILTEMFCRDIFPQLYEK